MNSADPSWLYWAIGLAFGLPVVLISLTEWHQHLARRHSALGRPVNLLRNYLVPLAALLLLFLLSAAPVAAAAADGVRPFHARYSTARNGDELGWTTLDLRDNGDGTWTLRTETKGTHGLARLAGVHVVETSVFRWRDGRPEALTYDFRQRGALRQRTRHAEFDWKAGKQTAEFPGDKFVGLVNRLAWAPDGSWLLGAGGAGEGFLVFLDGKTHKPLRQEKVAMHVHDFALSPDDATITSVGHNRITIHELG